LVVSAVLTLPGAVAAQAPVLESMPIEGRVRATASRWTADGSRIVTTATVATATGDVEVSQLGGTASGLTMRQLPGPALLAPGMRVAIAAHRDLDRALRPHVVVDAVRVLTLPDGYVRTGPTKAGNYLRWESGCVQVSVDQAGTKALPGDLEREVVTQSIAAWTTGTAACSYMEVTEQGYEDREVGRDGVNMIKFRDSSWCRPATDDDPARCYADAAAGITTAVYVDDASSDRDGVIVDADIEINGTDFAISHQGVTLATLPCLAELSNTLTHELGHLQGLEHTCLAGGDPARVDADGRAVPACAITSDPAILEPTMYNFQDCGEVKKATVEADDIAAMCGIYPRSEDPGTCEAVDLTPGGCCSAGTGPGPVTSLLGLAVVALGLGRRRRGGPTTGQKPGAPRPETLS